MLWYRMALLSNEPPYDSLRQILTKMSKFSSSRVEGNADKRTWSKLDEHLMKSKGQLPVLCFYSVFFSRGVTSARLSEANLSLAESRFISLIISVSLIISFFIIFFVSIISYLYLYSTK